MKLEEALTFMRKGFSIKPSKGDSCAWISLDGTNDEQDEIVEAMHMDWEVELITLKRKDTK